MINDWEVVHQICTKTYTKTSVAICTLEAESVCEWDYIIDAYPKVPNYILSPRL